MEKRVRSPNYPAFGLPEAIQKLSELYRNQHTHSAPREVVAKGMGYNSLNGASATAISALHKYGLLEKVGDEIKVSERALRILHPHDDAEKRRAITEAAMDPPLFAELAEKFPGRIPTDELLRNYLVRNGFAPGAVSAVVRAYRETSQFAEEQGAAYDSALTTVMETQSMPALGPISTFHTPPGGGAGVIQPTVNEREIGRYNFEDGGFVKIVADPSTDTEEVLSMAETVITLKRAELKRRKERDSEAAANMPQAAENSEEANELVPAAPKT